MKNTDTNNTFGIRIFARAALHNHINTWGYDYCMKMKKHYLNNNMKDHVIELNKVLLEYNCIW